MRYLLATLVMIWVVALPLEAQAVDGNLLPGIKGSDDRKLIRTTEYPWRAIGRVNKRTGGFCTGTVIGNRTVLTAAHCLWNTKTRKWLPPQSLHFVAGYQKGEYVVASGVVSLEVNEDFTYTTRPALSGTANDWALLKLKDDVGSLTGIIPVSTRPLPLQTTKDARLTQAGYSQDKAHMLTAHENCNFIREELDGRIFIHDCDAVKGDSGSPVLIRKTTEPRFLLVGIHVATHVAKAGKTYGIAVSAAHLKIF